MKDGTCVNNLDNWVKKSLSSKVLLPMTTILVWIWVKSSQSMQLACHCFLKLCDNNQLRAKNCCVNFASLLLQCSLFESGERIIGSVPLFCQIGQTTYPFSIAHKNTGFYRKCFLQTNLNCLLRTFFLLSIRISSSFWNYFKMGLSICRWENNENHKCLYYKRSILLFEFSMDLWFQLMWNLRQAFNKGGCYGFVVLACLLVFRTIFNVPMNNKNCCSYLYIYIVNKSKAVLQKLVWTFDNILDKSSKNFKLVFLFLNFTVCNGS